MIVNILSFLIDQTNFLDYECNGKHKRSLKNYHKQKAQFKSVFYGHEEDGPVLFASQGFSGTFAKKTRNNLKVTIFFR